MRKNKFKRGVSTARRHRINGHKKKKQQSTDGRIQMTRVEVMERKRKSNKYMRNILCLISEESCDALQKSINIGT